MQVEEDEPSSRSNQMLPTSETIHAIEFPRSNGPKDSFCTPFVFETGKKHKQG